MSEYEDYIWKRHADVYIGWEPPAQPGATTPDDDPVMRTAYVEQLLVAPAPYTLTWKHPRFGGTSTAQRRQLLHRRIRELRDHWVWLGETVSEGLWRTLRIRSFVYVRQDSPHAEVLIANLRRIIDVPSSHVDLEHLP